MSKYTHERFTYNAHWLTAILPAFMIRFDPMGQEDPRVQERIAEIWQAIEFIKKTSKVWFGEAETDAVRSNMRFFEEEVRRTISRSRNASEPEINALMLSYNSVIVEMLDLATIIFPAKRIK